MATVIKHTFNTWSCLKSWRQGRMFTIEKNLLSINSRDNFPFFNCCNWKSSWDFETVFFATSFCCWFYVIYQLALFRLFNVLFWLLSIAIYQRLRESFAHPWSWCLLLLLSLNPSVVASHVYVSFCVCVRVRVRIISWMANVELEQDGVHFVYSSARSELLFYCCSFHSLYTS